jgi:dTDP-4-amino-4,6-dideoxygalactose transaminase
VAELDRPWADGLQDFRKLEREFQRSGTTVAAVARSRPRKLVYQAPWAVPAWGWSELAATAASAMGRRVTEGPRPEELAEAVRSYLGRRYARAVGQARVGIELILRAAGAAGREVVMPSCVCSAVLEAVLRAGARPVFADIEEDLHISARTVAPHLTPRTKAVVVPHEYGNTAPIEGIEALLKGTGITLVDDAAQSFGARRAGRKVGSFGDAGVVSVGILKALSGAGGAVVLTDDAALYEKLRAIPLEPNAPRAILKRVGVFWVKRFRRVTWPVYLAWERFSGVRVDQPYPLAPLSNLDAAIGLAQFRNLTRNAARRRANARILLGAIAGLGAGCGSDFSADAMLLQLVVVLPESGPTAPEALELLAEAGVEARMSLVPCHYLEGGARPDLPNTEALWNRVLCLPVETTVRDPDAISKAVDKWLSSHPGAARPALVQYHALHRG